MASNLHSQSLQLPRNAKQSLNSLKYTDSDKETPMTNTQLQPNAVDVASKVARDLFAHTSHALSVLALVTVAIFALAEVPWATPALAADAVGSGPSRIVLSGSWERL